MKKLVLLFLVPSWAMAQTGCFEWYNTTAYMGELLIPKCSLDSVYSTASKTMLAVPSYIARNPPAAFRQADGSLFWQESAFMRHAHQAKNGKLTRKQALYERFSTKEAASLKIGLAVKTWEFPIQVGELQYVALNGMLDLKSKPNGRLPVFLKVPKKGDVTSIYPPDAVVKLWTEQPNLRFEFSQCQVGDLIMVAFLGMDCLFTLQGEQWVPGPKVPQLATASEGYTPLGERLYYHKGKLRLSVATASGMTGLNLNVDGSFHSALTLPAGQYILTHDRALDVLYVAEKMETMTIDKIRPLTLD